jgi:hypothetical protein
MAREQKFNDGFRSAVKHVYDHYKGINRTARLFGISPNAVRTAIRATVSRKRGRRPLRTKELVDKVLEIIEEDDIGLVPSEVRDKVWEDLQLNVSERTVRRIMEDNIITRKKIDKHAIERETEYNKQLTEQFLAEVCSLYLFFSLFLHALR